MQDHRFDPSISPQTKEIICALFAQDAFQVFPGSLHFAPLSGGFNNTNLVLTQDGQKDGQKWVLKIRPDDYAIFGADPASSISVQAYAADKGLAGRIVAADHNGLHFVTEFLDGQTVRPDLARRDGLLPQVVSVLHALHPGPCACAPRSFFDDIRLFMTGVADNKIPLPDGFEHMLSAAFEIEAALTQANPP